MIAIADYDYDAQNRVIVVDSGVAVTFDYNAADQRVEKTYQADTTKYIFDYKKLLQETDGADATTALYTSTLRDEYGDLVSQFRDGAAGAKSGFFQCDAIGSTNELTSDAAVVKNQYKYDGWGNAVLSDVDNDYPTPYTWIGMQGYYKDPELAESFPGKGVYDPTTGQTIKPDPIGLEGGDNNLYRWVHNNPVNKTDPSGLILVTPGGKNVVKRIIKIREFLDALIGGDPDISQTGKGVSGTARYVWYFEIREDDRKKLLDQVYKKIDEIKKLPTNENRKFAIRVLKALVSPEVHELITYDSTKGFGLKPLDKVDLSWGERQKTVGSTRRFRTGWANARPNARDELNAYLNKAVGEPLFFLGKVYVVGSAVVLTSLVAAPAAATAYTVAAPRVTFWAYTGSGAIVKWGDDFVDTVVGFSGGETGRFSFGGAGGAVDDTVRASGKILRENFQLFSKSADEIVEKLTPQQDATIRLAREILESVPKWTAPTVKKAVNSDIIHASEQAVARGVFPDVKSAREALRALGKKFKTEGLPPGTIPDPKRADSVLVPFGSGHAVYEIMPNETAVLRTVLGT